jgi:hypothetical protein
LTNRRKGYIGRKIQKHLEALPGIRKVAMDVSSGRSENGGSDVYPEDAKVQVEEYVKKNWGSSLAGHGACFEFRYRVI